MRCITRLRWLLPIFVVALIGVIFEMTRQSEAEVEVSSEGSKEVVVTIGPTDNSVLSLGDSLRKAFKFREAIEEYRKVVAMEGVDVKVKAEAQYNIGLCYTWIDRDEAEAVFQGMLQTYPNDGKATAYAHYCLAWLDIQKEELDAAIARLERMLEEQTCTDRELYARAQFQIGRIYLVFLQDYDRAQEAFRKVLAHYPDSKIAEHPFLDPLRTER